MASKKIILTLMCLTALTFAATGCGDDDSNPVAPAVDTAPPVLPSGLDLQYVAADRAVTVSWDQNVTDADFAGFLVSRAICNNEPVALVNEPQTTPYYTDNDLAVGSLVTYFISSVDESGNISAAATIVLNQDYSDEPVRDNIPQ